MKRIIISCLFLVFVVISCGKKGAPKPPEDFAPSPVRYLVVSSQVDSIKLQWSAPITDALGDELFDLQNFVVKKGDWVSGDAIDFESVAEIEAASTLTSSSGSAASEAGLKERGYSFVDREVEAGKVYAYLVTAVNRDGVEGVSSGMKVTFIGESSIVETLQ